jgi:hypothetical protein
VSVGEYDGLESGNFSRWPGATVIRMSSLLRSVKRRCGRAASDAFEGYKEDRFEGTRSLAALLLGSSR